MPDKGTMQDHIADLMAEVYRLAAEVEDYKAANTELRHQLELAREEARQAYKRADNYRNQVTALGERLAATFQIQGDLMRQLEEARNE